jgi:hypothetical protein
MPEVLHIILQLLQWHLSQENTTTGVKENLHLPMSQEEYLMQLHSIYNSNLTNHYWYKWNPKSLQNQNQTTEKTRYTHLSLCKHITKATTLSQPNGHFKTLIHLLKNSRSSF